jgi:hypothetical protein
MAFAIDGNFVIKGRLRSKGVCAIELPLPSKGPLSSKSLCHRRAFAFVIEGHCHRRVFAIDGPLASDGLCH